MQIIASLIFLYLWIGAAFVVADLASYSGLETMGPTYVREPKLKNLLLGVIIAPLGTLSLATSLGIRGGRYWVQLFFVTVCFFVGFFYQGIWLYVGSTVCMFLVRKSATRTH